MEEIEKSVNLESLTFECKGKLNREKPLSWLKTIAGFSNAVGGTFYVGVEDKTNKLVGFNRREADNERNYFNNEINQHLTPRPQLSIHFVRYEIRNQERFILRINVDESPIKPVILNYDGIPSIYMRRDGFTNGATYEEIHKMAISCAPVQYDNISSDVLYNPENFKTLRTYYAEKNEGKELSEKALKSMGFYDKNGYLKNGAVLFADDYNGDKTAVHCSVFNGLSKGSDRIIAINKFSGNLIDSIQYITDFVNQRMNHGILKLPDRRIDLPAYPKRALLEATVNAIAHRDYYLDGTQIQVDMFKDRLEITSPGGFYGEGNLNKTYDLSQIISKRRNELISNIFVACKTMEAAGTGFDKIIVDYANADAKHRPYLFSTSSQFTLVLPDLTYENGVIDSSIPKVQFIPVPNGSSFDARILEYCYYKARKASDIAAYLGISDSTYFRKNILENLAVTGYLEKSKAARAFYYKTNQDYVLLQ